MKHQWINNLMQTLFCYLWIKKDPLRTEKNIVDGIGTLTIVGQLSNVPKYSFNIFEKSIEKSKSAKRRLKINKKTRFGGLLSDFGPKLTPRWGQDRPKIAPRRVQDRVG